MKLPTLIAVVVISSNCFGQDLKDKMTNIVNDYLNRREVDSGAKLISLNQGTVTAPILCTNKRTGTIDSDRGELMYRQLLINYDIGLMAGTHAVSLNKNTFVWYTEKLINDNKINIGLKKNNDAWKLVMTIRKNSPDIIREEPANFWAEVKTEDEVKQVIAIVFSYKKK